ncbi:unnamed protein product [Arctogadus glacialis]
MEDHDYTASSFIVVDREKFESMSRQIEELTRQIETLHMERFGLQRFSASPSDIRYYSRNGRNLSETGPSLHLSSLTNNSTGNYTCSLDSSGQNTSVPWSLVVVEDEGSKTSRITLPVPPIKYTGLYTGDSI